jgi:hypothetical protein
MAAKESLMSQSVRFRTAEDGGITAFGIIIIGLMLMIMGVAIDVANAYRHRTQLQVAADAATRSGLISLARGENAAAARRAALAMIERNLPAARYGQLVTDPATELQVLHYDAATGTLGQVEEERPANAVVLRLQRSEAEGNPLPTLLLGLAGHDAWSLAVTSVAVLVPTRRCGNAEGIVARERLDLDSAVDGGVEFAEGFCLHSQTAVALPDTTRSAGPLRISLPDPAGCKGGCAPSRGTSDTETGGDLRPRALNLVMPQTRDHVLRLAAGFLDPAVTLPEETAFFATRPLNGDPEALREVGVATENTRGGDVLRITPLQFSQMRERPSGLIYEVACVPVENDARPLWERTVTLTGNGVDPTLRDLVLITDCAIEMDDLARVEGALIFMVGPGEARITAMRGATLGDPQGGCAPSLRVRLMTLGDLALPANLALSNVSAVAGGNIRLERDPDLWLVPHTGLVLHAGSAVATDGAHHFARCLAEPTSDPLLPSMQVITHAMPDLSGVLPPPAKPRRKTEMPGDQVKDLPMQGALRPGS